MISLTYLRSRAATSSLQNAKSLHLGVSRQSLTQFSPNKQKDDMNSGVFIKIVKIKMKSTKPFAVAKIILKISIVARKSVAEKIQKLLFSISVTTMNYKCRLKNISNGDDVIKDRLKNIFFRSESLS